MAEDACLGAYRKLYASKLTFYLNTDVEEYEFGYKQVTGTGKSQVVDKESPVLNGTLR
jgi:hypothetical protein